MVVASVLCAMHMILYICVYTLLGLTIAMRMDYRSCVELFSQTGVQRHDSDAESSCEVVQFLHVKGSRARRGEFQGFLIAHCSDWHEESHSRRIPAPPQLIEPFLF